MPLPVRFRIWKVRPLSTVMNRPGLTMLATRSARTLVISVRNWARPMGAKYSDMLAVSKRTTSENSITGLSTRKRDPPLASITISSLSPDRAFRTRIRAIISAKGATITIRNGSASMVMPMNWTMVCPLEVTRSSWRRAWVAQTTPVIAAIVSVNA